MKGAKEYAEYFETGQYNKLYIVSGSHGRGKTFHIYVLPNGEKAIPNGRNNPPLNKNAVEVYGMIGGHSGWTEFYGWKYNGEWEKDFNTLLKNKMSEITDNDIKKQKTEIDNAIKEFEKNMEVLKNY